MDECGEYRPLPRNSFRRVFCVYRGDLISVRETVGQREGRGRTDAKDRNRRLAEVGGRRKEGHRMEEGRGRREDRRQQGGNPTSIWVSEIPLNSLSGAFNDEINHRINMNYKAPKLYMLK